MRCEAERGSAEWLGGDLAVALRAVLELNGNEAPSRFHDLHRGNVDD